MGGHFWRSQDVFPIFGSKTADGTRTGAALTTAYTGLTKTIKTAGYAKLNLDMFYSQGAAESANTLEILFEGSPDGVNFYRIPNESNSSGVSTLYPRNWIYTASAATNTISIGIDVFYKYVKISAQEGGVAANAGNLFAEATLSGA